MNLESLPQDSDLEGTPRKSKAVDLLQAFGCGILILGGFVGCSHLCDLLVATPPLSWIPAGKSGPVSGLLRHWAVPTPIYWLVLIAPVSLFRTWRRRAKWEAMDREAQMKARRQRGKWLLISVPLGLPLVWFFGGFDVLKEVLAFLIILVVVLSAAVIFYRWRRKSSDEPPGVKVI